MAKLILEELEDRITPSGLLVQMYDGSPLPEMPQVLIGPKRPKCESIKLRITAVTDSARATLDTLLLFPAVSTSGLDWEATWRATLVGELGNALMMNLAFESSGSAAFSIEVRDDAQWDVGTQAWISAIGTIGVRVLLRSGSSPTVAQLEAAIAAGTTLATLTAPDPFPTDIIALSMVGQSTSNSFAGGAYSSPTGEALKLTALGLELGTEPGLFRRLTAAQKA